MGKSQFHRKGIDPGLPKVRPWIELWYGDSSEDIEINEFSMPVPSYHTLKQKTGIDAFRDAFKGNETQLHGFLKLVAWHWLVDRKESTPIFEQEMYFPIEELAGNVKIRGSSFDITKPQMIEKGRNDVIATYGKIIRSDVFCTETSVEVGYTQPLSICMPLLDELAERVVWLPYPKGVSASTFDVENSVVREVFAYEFKLRPI